MSARAATGDPLGLLNLLLKLGSASLEHLRDAVEHLSAVVRRSRPPRTLGGSCSQHRIAGILARRLGCVGKEAPLGVGHDVGAPALTAGEGTADKQLVGLADIDTTVHQMTSCLR